MKSAPDGRALLKAALLVSSAILALTACASIEVGLGLRMRLDAGGAGGTDGHAGAGGAAGTIVVSVDPQAQPYLSKLQFINKDGGGAPGLTPEIRVEPVPPLWRGRLSRSPAIEQTADHLPKKG
jgi:hypothetical protein